MLVGQIHVSRWLFQFNSVEGAALRFFMVLSQVSDCWRKVLAKALATETANVSSFSAPLAAMSSLALR